MNRRGGRRENRMQGRMPYRPSTAPATIKQKPGNNITVAVRVRPATRREARSYGNVVKVHAPDSIVFDGIEADREGVPAHVRANPRNKVYTFDAVFGEQQGTGDVFATTAPLLDDVLNGVNACVFAYGATGAGKTYTMAGTPDEPGVMVRMVEELLARMASSDTDYELAISYMEIYNEKIYDLLAPRGSDLPLRADGRGGVRVAGVSTFAPQTINQVMELLEMGNGNRSQAPTDVNATSSRSHALFEITVRSATHVGKMTLIDLAGSERASKTNNRGVRLREGAKINRSLLALGGCIRALCDGSSHVPFRNSKLTRMLADSLGGTSRTVVLACIAPTASSYEDTFNTLHYCERMKHVRKKRAISHARNLAPSEIIAALRAEIAELKAADADAEREADAARLSLFRAQLNGQMPKGLSSPILPPHLRRIVNTAASELESPTKRDLVQVSAANMQLKMEITRLRAQIEAGALRSPSGSPVSLTAANLSSELLIPLRAASHSPAGSSPSSSSSSPSTVAIHARRPFTSAGTSNNVPNLSALSLSPIAKRGSVVEPVVSPPTTPPPRKRRIVRKRVGRKRVVALADRSNKENAPIAALSEISEVVNWKPTRKPRVARVGRRARARGGVWK